MIKNMNMKNRAVLLLTILLLLCFVSCLRYLTHERSEALVEGVDTDQTLNVAADELEEGGWGSVLTLWAIRDQYISPSQASKIEDLYFNYIDSLTRKFNIWHLTWAVSNIYRLGNENVRDSISDAYNDAKQRAAKMGGAADKHVNGDKIYMGYAHFGGKYYAHEHVVVPGNDKYLQSYREYVKENR